MGSRQFEVARPSRRASLPAWVWIVLALLVLVRVPAIVQPLGPDQALYAYVGERILQGDLPYRDVWDQKPPGLHAAYAFLWKAWPNEAVVPLADTLLAVAVAAMLLPIAAMVTASRFAGPLAAGLFLLLGNPSFARFGGARLRGQGEVFIAAFVTAGVWLFMRCRTQGSSVGWRRPALALSAGCLTGLAALAKYPAAGYLMVGWAALALVGHSRGIGTKDAGRLIRLLAWSAVGLLLPVGVMVVCFSAGGALRDLWDATIVYNLRYSGETYSGAWAFAQYLVTFPVQHARVDGLWLLGGAGSIVLLARSFWRPAFLVPVIWIAVACLAIAINGSRGLPQYFLQAYPALALAAGVAGVELLGGWPRTARFVVAAVVLVAVTRVMSFADAAQVTAWDLARLAGQTDRATYLARFAGRPGDKYSAPDVRELGTWLGTHVDAGEPVYVFGFSAGAYLYSGRQSASRFFWNSPVIVGFNEGQPGYGKSGLLADLQARRPLIVALQKDDGGPGGRDSCTWFLSQPELATWLLRDFRPLPSVSRYQLYQRVAPR
jgi:hypothetical protein